MVWFYHSNALRQRTQLTVLSIPLWSDFILPTAPAPHMQILLSIPLWSDFIIDVLSRINPINPAFNPTMVWFYHSIEDSKMRTETTFNPTMVWFYPSSYQRLTIATETFNPTMVWFYPGSTLTGLLRVFKRALSIPLWSDFIWWVTSYFVYCPLSFNPTMVWFYLERESLNEFCFGDAFNPTMVWFYQSSMHLFIASLRDLSIPLWSDFIPSVASAFSKYSKYFQSHYGLILSSTTSYKYTVIFNFQSHYGLILSTFDNQRGRKTIQHNLLSIPLWSDFIKIFTPDNNVNVHNFQSHYGLILSCYFSMMRKDLYTAFNPTMVWFYLSIMIKSPSPIINFQSHYGLILSVNSKELYPYSASLSIPLWSDFNILDDKPCEIKTTRELSIPFWSDFIFVPLVLCVWSTTAFQSHFGLILSVIGELKGIKQNINLFQSHFGLILSR